MTVLLDKHLTSRQKWALEYLSGRSPSTTVAGFDCGADFTGAYGRFWEIEDFDRSRAALVRVLNQLNRIGLVRIEKTWGDRTYYPDCGPSHCNEYHITDRGRRAVVSHDTYDQKVET